MTRAMCSFLFAAATLVGLSLSLTATQSAPASVSGVPSAEALVAGAVGAAAYDHKGIILVFGASW